MFYNIYSLPKFITIIEGRRSDELHMKDGKAKGEIYTKFLSDYVERRAHLGEASVDERKTLE
jgi:hypothetical protein